MRSAPLLLLLAGLLASCSLQAKLSISETGPVGVDAVFAVSAPAQAAWASLRDLDPSLPLDPFDPNLLRRGLGKDAKVSGTKASTSLSFSVADPAKLFPGQTTADHWDLVIDRAAVRRFAALTTWADSPALDALLPAAGAKITEAEYRDLLVYLVGPGLTDAAARALVDGSTVQLTLEAPRPIVSAEGALSVSGRTAVYRWPLVRVLALTAPLRLKVSF